MATSNKSMVNFQGLDHRLDCFDCDDNGVLYGICQQSTGPSGPGAPLIISVDARHQILGRRSQARGSSASASDAQLHVSSTIKPTPDIDFDVKSVNVSPSGHYLLLTGYQGQEQECAVVAVIDLFGGHIQAAAPDHEHASAASSHRCKVCNLHFVDPQLYRSRPGLHVHQAAWHPHSENHVTVLTSDSRWRLYALMDLSLAEQTFDLRACLAPSSSSAAPDSPLGRAPTLASPTPSSRVAPSPLGRFGLVSSSCQEMQLAITAFCFGPPVAWGYFSVHFLASSGAVFTLCPVCPFGMRVPASVLKQALLFRSDSEGDVSSSQEALKSWLKGTFGSDAVDPQFKSKARWTAQGYVNEDSSPLMQGPLNAGCSSIHPAARGSSSHSRRIPAVTMHSSFQLEVGSGTESCDAVMALACTSNITVGFNDGRVYAHLCHGLLGPCWSERAPQCVLDVKGIARAVRYECDVVPLPPGLPGGVACGAMLLLDLVDLQLSSTSSSAAFDEDEDDLLQEAFGPGSSGMHCLRLLGSEESSQTVWAVHETGCWNMDFAWLPALSRALAQGDGQPGGSGLSSGDMERMDSALETVPPPSVKELLAVEGGQSLGAAACLHDMFLGDSLLVAMRQTGAATPASAAVSSEPAAKTWLRCFMQRQAVAASDPEGETEATAMPLGQGGAGVAAALKAVSNSVSNERKALLEVNLEAIYGDLRACPHVTLPKPTGPVGSEDAEGALHLHDCMQLMRQEHVEFIHRADQDLCQRMQQLGSEAGTQRSAVAELQALLVAGQERQAILAERSHRVLELHRNLAERAAILAQLHWSLPRPLSDEETKLAVELTTCQAKRQAFSQDWISLRKRLDAALQVRRADRSAAEPHLTASLPPAQATKVHAAIMEQFRLISSAMHDLKDMEVEVKQWSQSEQD